MKSVLFCGLLFLFTIATGCRNIGKKQAAGKENLPDQFLVVLGITQDAGYPQIGCEKECCKAYWEGKEKQKHITCLALVDRETNQYWLLEATPDITSELHALQPYLINHPAYHPAGVLITHAHIGHYTGLMFFGREAMGAKNVPVFAMPQLASFLQSNGPWSQLTQLKNIDLFPLKADTPVVLNAHFTVTPILVPHRDEFSETVGFEVQSQHKKILFIPDIDKWSKWNRNIITEVNKADLAFLDATFYDQGELGSRDMSEVPHPLVKETMGLFSQMPDTTKSKIVFIHFNHTNPLLKIKSGEKELVKKAGFKIAEEGMVVEL